MKVYNVGTSPITYTGAAQKLYTKAAQQIEPITVKGIDVLEELAEETLLATGKDDNTLNYLYKLMPIDCERKLEHFDGQRKISVYRGKNYMNKITQRLRVDSPPLTFIRSMENIGTNENPKLRTTAVNLRVPGKPEDVTIEFLQEKEKPLFLRVAREGFEAHRARYDNWHELMQDPIFRKVVNKIAGRPIF